MFSEALEGASWLMDSPGAYARGLLAGKPGERVDPRQLLQGWGMIGDEPDDSWTGWGRDMAVGALTDPLTYAGAFMGGGPGAASAFGKLGPRLGANASKLAGIVPEGEMMKGGAALAGEALASPAAKQILHEIPTGSKFLGAGAESLNLATPEGDVLKLMRHNPKAAIGVPDVEGVIQPSRRVVHGGYEVNRVPLASQVGDQQVFNQAREMVPGMNARGVDVFDLKPEDVGMIGGKPTILDMGSIDSTTPFSQIMGRTPGRFRNAGLAGGALGGSLAGAMDRY